MSRTSSAVKNRYNKKTYDFINAIVKKGDKEKFRSICEKSGININKAINNFIYCYMGEKK